MRKGQSLREKTLLTLCQDRKSSLSPQVFYCSSRLIPTPSNQSRDSPLVQFEIKPMALASNQVRSTIRSTIHSTWRHQSTIQDQAS